MRISQANKGKAAWNKGRKHSPETIARIKAATQAAMKRPEVDARIKAARFTRPAQTEETKLKISLHAKAKMALIREVMRVEVGKLQEIMAQHPDEDLRTFAQGPHFFQDVMSLSWFMFRSDWARISEVAADSILFHDALRRRIAEHQKRDAEAQSKSVLARARKQLTQLRYAEIKLQILEKNIARLRKTFTEQRADPGAEYRQAEAEAQELLQSCKRHVMKVTTAVRELDALSLG
ncbi:hypothetical protein QBZ16_000530 [Prototheca wickerhamii]|uniref:Nuclease associated modular domain-containing protein n=1 Tax=Prototheca wickerhamii TaxID=3111 RepID=A0AAD9ILH6_PROWI|nr:hypothetical protein QBZ16_000530 [Prototheca wickerhamii]